MDSISNKLVRCESVDQLRRDALKHRRKKAKSLPTTVADHVPGATKHTSTVAMLVWNNKGTRYSSLVLVAVVGLLAWLAHQYGESLWLLVPLAVLLLGGWLIVRSQTMEPPGFKITDPIGEYLTATIADGKAIAIGDESPLAKLLRKAEEGQKKVAEQREKLEARMDAPDTPDHLASALATIKDAEARYQQTVEELTAALVAWYQAAELERPTT